MPPKKIKNVFILFTDQDKIHSLNKKLSRHAPHHCSLIRQQNCSSLIIQTTASTVTAVTTTTTIPTNSGILICNCGNDNIVRNL